MLSGNRNDPAKFDRLVMTAAIFLKFRHDVIEKSTRKAALNSCSLAAYAIVQELAFVVFYPA